MKRQACKEQSNGSIINRERTHAEPYGTQLDALSNSAPPWPQTQLKNEKMYILPTRLNSQDSITVIGQMKSEPRILTVGLITGYSSADYDNIACQLEVNYPPYNEDKIVIKYIKDGYQQVLNENNATSSFFTVSDFKIKFVMNDGNLYINVGDSYLEEVELKHNIDEIRFLTVSGDVNKVSGLDFQFA